MENKAARRRFHPMPRPDKYTRARAVLATVPVGTAGEYHNAAFRAASILVWGFGMEVDEAFPVLREWAVPDWRDDELRHKLRSALGAAWNRAKEPRGHMLEENRQREDWRGGNGRDNSSRMSNSPASAAARPARQYRLADAGVAGGPAGARAAYSPPPPERPKVERNWAQLEDVAWREGWDLDALRQASGDIPQDAEAVADLLWPGNPLLCIALDKENRKHTATRRREVWRGNLARMQFCVPNPMSAVWGRTQTGSKSQRALSNACAPEDLQYLVCEFDFDGEKRPRDASFLAASLDRGHTMRDVNAALLLHLGKFAPLVMVVDSAGKSLHGWFSCSGVPQNILRVFQRRAASLGVDDAPWVRNQLVRLPWGLRPVAGEPQPRVQKVLYFNERSLPSHASSKEES